MRSWAWFNSAAAVHEDMACGGRAFNARRTPAGIIRLRSNLDKMLRY
jgi:hypothetical protein